MDKLTNIENRYNLKDVESWQFLRNPYHFYISNDNLDVSNTQTYSSKLNRFKFYIKNIFLGFRHWFRKYDYIIFDVSDNYKEVEGSFRNRFTEEISKNLDKKKILHIQDLWLDINYKTDDYIVSNSIIIFIAKLISKFFVLEDSNIYNKIKINEDIKLNFKSTYQTLMARSFIIKFILKIYNPKIVFLTSYNKKSEMLASKELGIKTVEVQHGIIDILPYKSNNFNPKFQPNYIFVFGNNDKKILEKTNYIENKNNIFTVGSYLLEKTIENKTNILDKYRKNYKQIVSISIQDPIIEETKEFINSVAKDLSSTLFILIPRSKNIILDELSKNIIVISDKNCLDIVKNSHWHLTAFSTCAFESASLGVANIFWNYKNFSKIYFEEYINSRDYNLMVNTKNELIEILNQKYIFDKSNIILQNRDYYMDNYSLNIKDAIYLIDTD